MKEIKNQNLLRNQSFINNEWVNSFSNKKFPVYNWRKNKGYPTSEHRERIKKYGISCYHRKSFQLLAKDSNSYI